MDDDLSRQALRLALGAELTHRAGRIAGGRIALDADLAALARGLEAMAEPVERAHGLRFDPPYPGDSGGVEELRGGRRLVLRCTAFDAADTAATVVFTTLIAGHPPRVSAAPPEAV